MKSIAEKRAARAVQIATLAVEINGAKRPFDFEESVKAAEEFLTAAENLVAKSYGEFR